MSEKDETDLLDEVEISEGDASSYSDQDVLDRTIEIIEQERQDIRTIIQSSLSVSGLLLTISLGALYFSYNSYSIVALPINSKESLFISAFCLTISIFINILALRMKPIRPIETEDRAILLKESYTSEKRHTNWSMFFLLVSVLGMFYGMGAFAWDQANIDIQISEAEDIIDQQTEIIVKSVHHFISSQLSSISTYKI